MASLLDCGLRIALDDPASLLAHLPVRWRSHLAELHTVATTAVPAPPPHVDWDAIELAVLLPPTDVAAANNLELAAALARAVNDWQVAEWLAPERRARGSIVVAHEDAELAVEEIERRAGDRRFVQVVVPAVAHAPFGDRRYWSILAAVERHGLPLCLTGAPSPHLSSLVFNGAFERYPKLRVLSVGGGCGWLPPLTWRLDGSWRMLKDEVPELTRLPSEYVRDHLWFDCATNDEPHLPSILDHLGYDDRVVAVGDRRLLLDAGLLVRNALALHADRL